jgi:hypothetical protein
MRQRGLSPVPAHRCPPGCEATALRGTGNQATLSPVWRDWITVSDLFQVAIQVFWGTPGAEALASPDRGRASATVQAMAGAWRILSLPGSVSMHLPLRNYPKTGTKL